MDVNADNAMLMRGEFKLAWYMRTWFLCILFAGWIFVLPLIAGVFLLIKRHTVERGQRERYKEWITKLFEAESMEPVRRELRLNEINAEIKLREDERDRLASDLTKELDALKSQIAELRKVYVEMDEVVLLQSFGLYEPQFSFANSEKYKTALQETRNEQKSMIKLGTATTGLTDWSVDGNKSQGKKMVNDTRKLLLRAFNSECDDIISRVKYNNYDASVKRIENSRDAISKLGAIMQIEISSQYYSHKLAELRLALEYQIKKQEEKDEQRKLREQAREEAKLQKEIEAERKKIAKEQEHYKQALEKIRTQLLSAPEAEREDLLQRQTELEHSLTDADTAMQNIDYRAANQRAGYVYIISNIGAFGENVYKIGMTRRLEPTDRIDELGDASVPFNFDIHAMIFSDDAPALETALHNAFENKKLNWVNTRREFFHVSLDEIKAVVRQHYDKTAEFVDTAEAEQYRTSKLLMAQTAGSAGGL